MAMALLRPEPAVPTVLAAPGKRVYVHEYVGDGYLPDADQLPPNHVRVRLKPPRYEAVCKLFGADRRQSDSLQVGQLLSRLETSISGALKPDDDFSPTRQVLNGLDAEILDFGSRELRVHSEITGDILIGYWPSEIGLIRQYAADASLHVSDYVGAFIYKAAVAEARSAASSEPAFFS